MKKRSIVPLPGPSFLKFLLIMKLYTILMLLFCLQLHARTFSQDKITLELKEVNIKRALSSVQKITSYRFVYNDDLLPAIKVSLSVSNASIEEVLNIIFQSTGLTYKLLPDNLVVISHGSKNTELNLQVTGTVRLHDREGSVFFQSGVSVIEKDNPGNGTVTNDNGGFSLNVQDTNAVLQVSYIGYTGVEVPLNGKTSFDIILEYSSKELPRLMTG